MYFTGRSSLLAPRWCRSPETSGPRARPGQRYGDTSQERRTVHQRQAEQASRRPAAVRSSVAAMDEPVITLRGLRKSYGSVEAVRGIDLEVHPGQVFAFLGPNGAGKTTTVEILEGYRSRDAGEVRVLGHDPARPTRAWYARLGVVLQTNQLQP